MAPNTRTPKTIVPPSMTRAVRMIQDRITEVNGDNPERAHGLIEAQAIMMMAIVEDGDQQ